MKQENYYILYTKRQRFPFNVYVYRAGAPVWIASVERTKEAESIADKAEDVLPLPRPPQGEREQ